MSVSTTITSEIDAQPISLFIDLFPNTNVDLGIVAEASLAFVRALRAAAQELAPDHELRVELVSGTEGSLSLNSVIRFIHDKTGLDRTKVRAVAIAAAGWFVLQGVEYAYNKSADAIYDSLFKSQKAEASVVKGLSEGELHQIAEELVRLERSPAIQKNVGQLYKALEKGVAVRGIGIRLDDLHTRPDEVVPRSEFHSRTLDAAEIQAVESHRERRVTETVKLITAVLDPTSNRKWVVETTEGTKSAVMMDKVFVSLLQSGQIQTRLSANMKLEADLMFSETKNDTGWRVVSVSIVHVRRIVLPNSAETLSAPARRKEP